jgi:hypothetical protein
MHVAAFQISLKWAVSLPSLRDASCCQGGLVCFGSIWRLQKPIRCAQNHDWSSLYLRQIAFRCSLFHFNRHNDRSGGTMRSFITFAHRANANGSFDSICLHCFQAVATAPTEDELVKIEVTHSCLQTPAGPSRREPRVIRMESPFDVCA